MANAAGISDELNSIYSENSAAINEYTADAKPTSNQSTGLPPDSNNTQGAGAVESSVLRGVKGILVQSKTNSQIALEQSAYDNLGYGEEYPPSWTATKEKGLVNVKCTATDPNHSDHMALWDVVKKNQNYCIQPKNIRAFVLLRPKEAPAFDPVLWKYLCEGDVSCDSLGKANWEDERQDFPCLKMEKLKGGQYIVKYPKVEKIPALTKLPEDPLDSPQWKVKKPEVKRKEKAVVKGAPLRNSFKRYPDFLNEEPNCSAILFMDLAQLSEYVATAPNCNEPRNAAWFHRRFLKINNQSKGEGCAIRFALSNDAQWTNATCTINGEKPFICQNGVFVQLLVCPDDR